MSSADIDLRRSVLHGMGWVASGQFAGQLVSWVGTIVVIRLLTPADYGLMAMSTSFVWLLTMMSELGIGASLIQAREVTALDIRRVQGVVMISSAIFALVGCGVAPAIAAFYGEPRVTRLVQVTSLGFLMTALYVVPQSIVVRDLNFRLKSAIDVAAQVTMAVVTVGAALGGSGVWALAIGPLAGHTVRAVLFNLRRARRIRPAFDLWEVARFIRYGVTITGDRFAYYCHTVSDTAIVGRLLGDVALGTYSVALTLASLPSEKVLPILTQVSFASYARIQDDPDRIARNAIRSVHLVALVAFPLFFLMAAVGPEAIALVLGPKWASMAVPFQVLCLVMPLRALAPILPPAVFATGRPTVNLINMTVTFAVMAAAFLAGAPHGLLGVCLAWVIAYPPVFLFATARCARAIGLRLSDVLQVVWFPAATSALMLLTVAALKHRLMVSTHVVGVAALATAAVCAYALIVFGLRRDEYARLKQVLFR